MTSENSGLVRAIGRWSLAALVVNAIIGSGIFGLPADVARLVGRFSPLAWLAAAVPIAFIIACFAEVSSRFSEAGGPYLYTRAALGRFLAILTGWLMWLVRLTAAAAGANLFVTYLREFWPGATDPVARMTVLGLLIFGLALVNVFGIRSGTLVSNLFTVAKLAPLAALIAGGLLWMALARPAPPAHAFAAAGWRQWMDAVLLLVFAYGGFEAALIPMGEARNPRRDAPFALFVALITCIVVYTLIQVVVMGTVADPAHAQRPLAEAARAIRGDRAAALVTLGALVSVFGYMSAMLIVAPRLTFALAEEGDFPRFFAELEPRYRTPHVSILGFAVMSWLLAVLGNFQWNVLLSALSRLFTYALVCLALPVLRRQQPQGAQFHLPAAPLFVTLGAGLSLALLTRMGPLEARIMAVTALIALANWVWVRGRPAGHSP